MVTVRTVFSGIPLWAYRIDHKQMSTMAHTSVFVAPTIIGLHESPRGAMMVECKMKRYIAAVQKFVGESQEDAPRSGKPQFCFHPHNRVHYEGNAMWMELPLPLKTLFPVRYGLKHCIAALYSFVSAPVLPIVDEPVA